MSGYLQGQVWFRDVRGSEREILLALADHAQDDGTRIYPSMEYLAWKVGLKKRRVQQVVAELRRRKVLIVEQDATRYEPTHYRMDLSKLPAKPPAPKPGMHADAPLPRDATSEQPGVQSDDTRGATQSAPESSGEPSRESSRENGRARDVEMVWGHYQKTVPNGERYKLDHQRRLMIAKALKVRSVEECCRAIDGLAASEYHVSNGYLDIKYALVGGGRSPSVEGTIDRLGAQAAGGVTNGRHSAARSATVGRASRRTDTDYDSGIIWEDEEPSE